MSDDPFEPDAARAEELFVDLLVRVPGAGRVEVDELCLRHPRLAATLRELLRQKERLDGVQEGLAEGALLGRVAPAAAISDLPPRLGPFQPLALLGRGGMGEVWEAVDAVLERRVALKLLQPGAHTSPTQVERFRREALAAGRLNHPGVVGVLSAGELDGRLFIAQELVAGGRTLRDEIEAVRRAVEVPRDHEQRMARLFHVLADALCAAHAAGIVHRDLKPQNVLLAPDGTPRLADFGLAKLAGDAALSRSGEFVGTWPYASPEVVAHGATAADERSDVFSLGATLYEALTFVRPFPGDSLQAIIRQILEGDPLPPHMVRGRVPRDLSAICLRALAKSPDRRYASMADLREDLRRFLADEPTRARTPSALARGRRWVRRHPAWSSSFAVALAGVLSVVVLLLRSEGLRRAAEQAREAERRVNVELASSRDEARGQAQVARNEAALSEDVLLFLEQIFGASDPLRYGLEPPSLHDIFERGVERLRTSGELDVRARARLSATLGTLLVPLGGFEQGQELLEEACETWERLGLANEPQALRARAALAGARVDLGQDAEAEALLRPLVERFRDGALEPAVAVSVFQALGLALRRMGRWVEAEGPLIEGLELARTVHGDEAQATVLVRSQLASLYYLMDRLSEAEALLVPDAERLAPLIAAGNPVALDVHNTWGLVLQRAGRLDEAEELFEEALIGAHAGLGPVHPRTISFATNLATVLEDLGRPDEAEQLYRETLDASDLRDGPTSVELATAQNNLATILFQSGRFDEAERLLREVYAGQVALRGSGHVTTVSTAANLAHCLALMGRGTEGVSLLEEALRALPADVPLRGQLESILEAIR